MAEGMKKAFVVYCSQAGSTRHAAQVIEKALDGLNVNVRTVDLGKEKKWEPIFQEIVESGNRACLFIGSPVYAGHPVPPIMQFIERMPATPGLFPVPFVTWGQVVSGLALYDMVSELRTKNVKVIGGAKILAVHSMMWDSPRPLGHGHPNAASSAGPAQRNARPTRSPARLSPNSRMIAFTAMSVFKSVRKVL